MLLAAGVIGWLLFAASRRRKWDAAFAAQLAEGRWVVDSLVPSVTDQYAPAEEIVRRWSGDQRRLDDLQTQLARLADTASGSQRTARVTRVSEAVTTLRQALASDVALRSVPGVATTSEAGLAQSRAVVQSRADALLAAVQDRPAPV